MIRVAPLSPAPPRRAPAAAACTIAALLAGACAGPPSTTTQHTARLAVPADRSAPLYGQAPFPGDAWRGPDGHIEPPANLDAVAATHTDLLAAHLATLDGWGVRPLVEFFIDGDLDPTALPATTSDLDAPAFVIDVDPDSPHQGRVVPYDWRWQKDRQVLAGSPHPGQVLDGGTTYAAVLTTEVLDADGQPLAPSPALGELAAGAPAPRWQTTTDALATLMADPAVTAAGARRIAAVTVFTTERATRTLRAARALLDHPDQVAPAQISFPDPTLIFAGPSRLHDLLGDAARFPDGSPRAGQERWGYGNPTGMAHDHVGVIATGRIQLSRFRRPATGSFGPDDQTFDPDDTTGAPRVIAADSIPITLVLPAAPPPDRGYPVILFGHGLGSSRQAVLTFAEPLTAAGYALVAIDADGHGSRYRDVNQRNNLASTIPQFTGAADMPDGFGDETGLASTFAFLGQLENFSGARDAIRESVLDWCQVIAALRADRIDLAPLAGAYGGTAPGLDSRHLVYLGESFGTILGGLLAAIEPDVDLYVLDVPAAAVVNLAMVSSPGIATLVVPLATLNFGLEGRLDRFHPAIALVQALVDPADPLTYAPHVLRDRFTIGDRPLPPRSVIYLEVVGDEVIYNGATDAGARALGLEVLEPSLTVPDGMTAIDGPARANVNGQTGVLVQYAPATHGSNWTAEHGVKSYLPGFPFPGDDPFPTLPHPITIPEPMIPALEQVVGILDSHADGSAPEVVITAPPVNDFDGDGMTDDEEIARGRDPYDPAH